MGGSKNHIKIKWFDFVYNWIMELVPMAMAYP